MPAFLRQSTAGQVIEVGPFLDDTDFKTPKTALTIANTDLKLRKGNGTTHINKNSGGATSIANGYYHATLDATDTNTVGILDVHVNMATALPVFDRYTVLAQAVYDQLASSTANLGKLWDELESNHLVSGSFGNNFQIMEGQVGAFLDAPISGIPASKLTKHAAAVLACVIGSGSTPTAVKLSTVEGAAPSAVDNYYNGAILVITSGALTGQRVSITDYDGATTTLTTSAFTSAPVNGMTGVIV